MNHNLHSDWESLSFSPTFPVISVLVLSNKTSHEIFLNKSCLAVSFIAKRFVILLAFCPELGVLVSGGVKGMGDLLLLKS